MTHNEWIEEMKYINSKLSELSEPQSAVASLTKRRQELLKYLVDNHLDLLTDTD